MIPIDKIAHLIPYQDMSTAREINKTSRSYEVRKSFYDQTDKETKWWVPLYIACKYWRAIVIKSINW